MQFHCPRCNQHVERHQCSYFKSKPYWCKACNTRVKFVCRNCDRRYNSYSSCIRHQRTVHDGRRYECPKCTYKTKYPQLLNAHVNRHNPLKVTKGQKVLYGCANCKNNFLTAERRDKHMKRCGFAKYQCEHCQRKFDMKGQIMAHMRICLVK